MFIDRSGKSNKFHIFIVLLVTLGAIYYVREELNEPLVEWQNYNEIRVAQIQALIEE